MFVLRRKITKKIPTKSLNLFNIPYEMIIRVLLDRNGLDRKTLYLYLTLKLKSKMIGFKKRCESTILRKSYMRATKNLSPFVYLQTDYYDFKE